MSYSFDRETVFIPNTGHFHFSFQCSSATLFTSNWPSLAHFSLYINSTFHFRCWLGCCVHLITLLSLCVYDSCALLAFLLSNQAVNIAWSPQAITVDILWVSLIKVLQMYATCNHHRACYLIHITYQVIHTSVNGALTLTGTWHKTVYHCDWAIPSKATICHVLCKPIQVLAPVTLSRNLQQETDLLGSHYHSFANIMCFKSYTVNCTS